MPCYKNGSCGPYEMYSCSECPASKPEYALRNQEEGKTSFFAKQKESRVINQDIKEVALKICNTEIGMFEEFKKRLKESKSVNEEDVAIIVRDFFIANANVMKELSDLEKKVFDK